MKLRKNDLVELRKGGVKAVSAKLKELAADYAVSTMNKMKNELKNPREMSSTRRAIAKLKTIITELKGEM